MGKHVKFNSSFLKLIELCNLKNLDNWAENIAKITKRPIDTVRSWNNSDRRVPPEVILNLRDALKSAQSSAPDANGGGRQGREGVQQGFAVEAHLDALNDSEILRRVARDVGTCKEMMEEMRDFLAIAERGGKPRPQSQDASGGQHGESKR